MDKYVYKDPNKAVKIVYHFWTVEHSFPATSDRLNNNPQQKKIHHLTDAVIIRWLASKLMEPFVQLMLI